ncbi:hypothetical protein JCM9279_006734 [Rhodotorula babjevae]
MGLDITKGALKAASKPKAKPKPTQRPLASLSTPTPSAASSLAPGTPHSPAAAAPASLDSLQQPQVRAKQTARRSGHRRRSAGAAPSRSAPQEQEDGSLGTSNPHEGSLGPAHSSMSAYGAHGESLRRRADESVGESPPIVVDATASSSSGSGGSDGELEAQLNGFGSPWSRQYASSKAPPVVRGGRRFEQPSASTSRSFATAATASRPDPFASAQDYIPLEHQSHSLASTTGPGADVGMEEATPEPQLSQGRGSSSPISKLQSPGLPVVDRYGREEDQQEQEQGRVQAQGGVEGRERSLAGEVGRTSRSSPDAPTSYKRRISEVFDDEEGEPAGRRKRAETVEEDEYDDYDDTLSFVSNSQDRASASPDPRSGTSLGPSSLSQNSRAPGSRSTTIIETFLRSDTPFDEAFERDDSPMAASEDERERREGTPFPFSNGDADGNGDGQRSPSFSPAPAEDLSSSSLEQLQPQAQPAHEPRRARATLPPSLAEHYGAEVAHPHFYHATLLAASVGAPEGEGEGEDGTLSWEDEKEGFVRKFKTVTDQVGELYDRQALHFSTIAHELEQHGEHLAATAHKLGETKERVREWGKPMFEAARGGGVKEGKAAGAEEGGEKVEEKKVEEGGEEKDGAKAVELDENGEA